jgi:hypothetical protein
MGMLKKLAMSITGGRKGVVSAHVLTVIENLEIGLTKRKLQACHRSKPVILCTFCASVATHSYIALIGDGQSHAFALSEKVLSNAGYGTPSQTTPSFDLGRPFASDIYSQDEIKMVFARYGVTYTGSIDQQLIEALAYVYVRGVIEGDKGTRAGVMGALANIIDPSAKTWDDSKVNLDFI